jgi:endonuclease/exonuclease/phosphatase family metal-dependent hydrolase
MTRFRLVTYNIHKCRGLDWKTSPYRILNVLQDIHADIVALQESFEDQARFLADHLNMHLVFGSARRLQSRHYGNAVLCHGSVLSSRCHDLTVSKREPRSCLRVDVQIAEDLMAHVFAVHLGTSYLERRRQAGKLVSPDVLEAPDAKGLRIVAGDFNEWSQGLVSRILSHHMRSADLAKHFAWKRSYPGLAPFLHLDHIYYDGAMHLNALRLHRTAVSLVASDHLPLIGDFEVTH